MLMELTTVQHCMAGDKTHIAQVEKLEYGSPTFYVTIMDSRTLKLLYVLPLLKSDGSLAEVCDVKVSISSTFYESAYESNLRSFSLITVRLCKILMKLTKGVNFTNILQSTFVPISFGQKIYKPKL